MSRNSEHIKRWRHKTKQRLIDSLGGECVICGYNKCNAALELHHLNEGEKEFSFGQIIANPKAWERIVDEVRKCVLLCACCHREVHHLDGVEVPEDAPRFNEEYADYKSKEREETRHLYYDDCPVCGEEKNKVNKTCPRACAATLTGSVNWKTIDLIEMKERLITWSAMGNELGISDSAVRKRWMKLYEPNNKPKPSIWDGIDLIALKEEFGTFVNIANHLGVHKSSVGARWTKLYGSLPASGSILDKYDLVQLRQEYGSFSAIAKHLNVGASTVSKRWKKLYG